MSLEEDALRADISRLQKRVKELEQWVGTHSEQSPEKQETITSENKTTDPQLVQTTENHSEKDKTESSDVLLMDGLNDELDFLS